MLELSNDLRNAQRTAGVYTRDSFFYLSERFFYTGCWYYKFGSALVFAEASYSFFLIYTCGRVLDLLVMLAINVCVWNIGEGLRAFNLARISWKAIPILYIATLYTYMRSLGIDLSTCGAAPK